MAVNIPTGRAFRKRLGRSNVRSDVKPSVTDVDAGTDCWKTSRHAAFSHHPGQINRTATISVYERIRATIRRKMNYLSA
jgi:hypothetical protein